MKKIKDYLHLYLGCDMLCVSSGNEDYEYKGRKVKLTLSRLSIERGKYYNIEIWKPILRSLSSMTDNEIVELFRCDHPEHSHPIITRIERTPSGFLISARDKKMRHSTAFSLGHFGGWKPEEFLHLLSKHFDLFGLIKAGLAIDNQLATASHISS